MSLYYSKKPEVEYVREISELQAERDQLRARVELQAENARLWEAMEQIAEQAKRFVAPYRGGHPDARSVPDDPGLYRFLVDLEGDFDVSAGPENFPLRECVEAQRERDLEDRAEREMLCSDYEAHVQKRGENHA